MPLQSTDPSYKASLLQKNGFDPDKYEMDDDGAVYAKVAQGPSYQGFTSEPIQQSAPVQQQGSSAAGAFAKHAAGSALPTLGGLGAAAMITAAPFTDGLSLLPMLGLGTAAAVGGSYATQKAQDALLPDAAKQSLAQSAQEHPWASRLGDVAPSAAFFNPVKGLGNMLGIGVEDGGSGVLGSLAKGVRNTASLTAPETSRVINAGINSGVQSGLNVANQLSNGQPFDWGSLGFDAASGALLSEPTALGSKFFPGHSQGEPAVAGNGTTEPIPVDQTPKAPVEYPPTPNPISGDAPNSLSGFATPAENVPVISKPKTDAMFKWLGDMGVPDDQLNAMEAEGNPTQIETPNVEGDLPSAQAELEATNKEEQQANYAQQIQQSLNQNSDVSRSVSSDTSGVNPQRDNTKRVQVANQEVAQGTPGDLQNRQAEGYAKDKYQPLTGNESEKNPEQSVNPDIQAIAKKRGITYEQAKQVFASTVQEVRGKYSPSDRVATVSSSAGTSDTPYHELQHGFIEDLQHSSIKADNDFAKKALDIYGGDPVKADEALAQSAGEVGAKRAGESTIGQWGRDVLSHIKTKLGLASDADILRHLSNRLETDAPRGSRGETSNSILQRVMSKIPQEIRKDIDIKGIKTDVEFPSQLEGSGGLYKNGRIYLEKGEPVDDNLIMHEILHNYVEKHPELVDDNRYDGIEKAVDKLHAEILSKNADKDSYDKSYSNLSQMIKEGKAGTPEFQEAWKEMENIKNRNGGMPPTKNQPLLGGKREIGDEKVNALDHKTVPGLRSEGDVVRLKEGLRAEPFLKGAGKAIDESKQLYGKYNGMLQDAIKGLKPEENTHIENILHRESNDKQFYKDELSPKEQVAYDKLRTLNRTIQEDRIAAKQPVSEYSKDGTLTKREAKIDPYYWPNRIDPTVADAIRHGKPGSEAYVDSIKQHLLSKGSTPEVADKMIDSMRQSWEPNTPNSAHFRALDIAQGAGLPYDVQRPGLERNMQSYLNSVARARAFHDQIESRADVAPLVGIKNNPWGIAYEGDTKPLVSSEARDIFARLKGEDYHPDEAKIKPYIGVANSLALGPLTTTHIMASSIANAQAYLRPAESVSANVHALTNFSKSIRDATSTGSYQLRRPAFKGLLDAHATAQERLRILADGIGTIQGRGFADRLAKGYTQGIGDYLVRTRSVQAAQGDREAISLMKSLDPDWSPDKVYDNGEIAKAASAFSNMLHGGHDFRTLPGWMLKDTILQPFMSLASWNIAQTNQFMKHVWTPATKGNFTPLIMSTLGAALGGYVLKEGRESLANKKSPIPGLEELVRSDKGISGNLPLVAYNLAAMGSYSGYAGILSTGARTLFDLAYKNPVQGAMFPLDEILSSSGKTLSQSASALMNSPSSDYGSIALHASADLLRENIQSARLAASWGDESGVFGGERQRSKELNNATRDLRNFKMVEGLPYDDESSIDESNPYYNMSAKHFQKAGDLQSAAQQLPQAINTIFSQSNGDMETIRNKLKVLKESSYPSMPSPERQPMTYWRYIKYLNDTQGPEVASQRVSEYMQRNFMNQMKGSIVPSF